MRSNEEYATSVLAGSYLFKAFDQSDLDIVTWTTTCKIYEAGEIIFDQGSKAESLFIIGYGTVALEINDHEDYESNPVLLGSGDTFGESHYHLREKRLGAAKAREHSEVFEIKYDDLSKFLDLNTGANLKFTQALSVHLGRYCHILLEGMMNCKVKLPMNEGISSFV